MDEKRRGRELTHSSCYIKHSLPRSKGKRRRNGKYSTASCRIFSNLNHSHKMRSLSTFLHLFQTTKVQIISVEIVIRYEGWFLSLTQPLQLLLLYICYKVPCVSFLIIMNDIILSIRCFLGYMVILGMKGRRSFADMV